MRFGSAVSYSAIAVAALGCVSVPAHAQAGDDKVQTSMVDDIVVTAQRTNQSVLSVPMSIQAVTGEELTQSGIAQLSDMQLTTPGFVPSNASGYNQIYIRGVGNSIYVGADPSVSTFIDDVPRVFGSMVNNFVDVERVEVLKGAPGGLYGRNSTGGAVNIITRQPSTNALSAKFQVSYGEKDTFHGSGFVNLPISDKVALTVAGERRSHDDYVRNITTGRSSFTAAMFPGGAPGIGLNAQQTADFFNAGLEPKSGYSSEDFWAVSSKLLFKPTDNFKITIAGDYSSKDDDNGLADYNISPVQTQASLAGFIAAFTGATPNFPAGFLVPTTEKFTVAQSRNGFVKLKDYGVSATAVLNLDGIDLTSITAQRWNRSNFDADNSFASAPIFGSLVNLQKEVFYQELRGVSTGSGPLHYIVGASFLRAQFEGQTSVNILPPLVQNQLLVLAGYVVKNWSAYAQADYDLTDHFTITASGRYIHETNNAHFTFPTTSQYSQTEQKFLPAVTISYGLPDGGKIYARWARGFKSGGINPLADPGLFPDPQTQGGAFKGENVDTFEAGVRTRLFDRRVQLTTAVFYNNYRDIQFGATARPAYAQVPVAMVNAGNARTYGAEATITARVADPLTIGAGAGYLNARYKQGFGIPASNPVLQPLDLSNARMLNSPKWQLNFNADFDQPVSDRLRLVANALASYTSDSIWYFRGASYLPDAVGPSYWLVNARVGLRTTNDNYELSVFAKNLFNKGYTTYGASSAASGTVLVWGEPRIVGVEATLKF